MMKKLFAMLLTLLLCAGLMTAASAADGYTVTFADDLSRELIAVSQTSGLEDGDLVYLTVNSAASLETLTVMCGDETVDSLTETSYNGYTHRFRMPAGNVIIAATFYEAIWGASADSLTNLGSLDAALDAAVTSENGVYIKLLTNVSLDGDYGILGGEFTLDLNGKTISSDASYVFDIRKDDYFDMTPSVTIDDTSAGGKGEIFCTAEENDTTIRVYGAALTIQGGTVRTNDSDSQGIAVQLVDNAVMTLKDDGQIAKAQIPDDIDYGIYVDASSTLNIEGGTIDAEADGVMNEGGTVIMTGGTINSASNCIANHGTATIKGGALNGGIDCFELDCWGGTLAIEESAECVGWAVRLVGNSTVTLPDGIYGNLLKKSTPTGRLYADSEFAKNEAYQLTNATACTVTVAETTNGSVSGAGR